MRANSPSALWRRQILPGISVACQRVQRCSQRSYGAEGSLHEHKPFGQGILHAGGVFPAGEQQCLFVDTTRILREFLRS